jgi:transposase-like protein
VIPASRSVCRTCWRLRGPKEAVAEQMSISCPTLYAWLAELGAQMQSAVVMRKVDDAEQLTCTRRQSCWGHDCIAATARAVDMTNASPRATPSARTSG